MPNNRMALYVLLVVCGTLLSGWGWWATISILEAATQQGATVAEWSGWRGQMTEKMENVRRELADMRKELEEIKIYLRSKGWKQSRPDATPPKEPRATRPAIVEESG